MRNDYVPCVSVLQKRELYHLVISFCVEVCASFILLVWHIEWDRRVDQHCTIETILKVKNILWWFIWWPYAIASPPLPICPACLCILILYMSYYTFLCWCCSRHPFIYELVRDKKRLPIAKSTTAPTNFNNLWNHTIFFSISKPVYLFGILASGAENNCYVKFSLNSSILEVTPCLAVPLFGNLVCTSHLRPTYLMSKYIGFWLSENFSWQSISANSQTSSSECHDSWLMSN